MPGKKFSDALIEEAMALREEGKSCGDIAKITGMSRSAVSWHCLKHGAEVPNAAFLQRPARKPITVQRGNHIVRQFTPKEDALLLEMDIAGETLADIARALGRKGNSVRARMQTLARNQERAEQRGEA